MDAVHDEAGSPIISIRDLWFRHPTAEVPALRGIDLEIFAGECVGIIGPSGAGKSTLCQVIKGIIPHSTSGELEGSVRAFGVDIAQAAELKVTARIGLVLQDPEAQIIGMTVAEDLAFGPENYAMDPVEIHRRSITCLSDVGLSEFMDVDTYALSGGQKQRLAIAAALMLEPDVLVLDEPTSELDPLGKDQVFEIVEKLKLHSNVTVVIVEHEVDRLVRVADRIVIVQEGQIAADGPPLEVFSGSGLLERTAGERLPAAVDLVTRLNDSEQFPAVSPTLDLDRALDEIAHHLEGATPR